MISLNVLEEVEKFVKKQLNRSDDVRIIIKSCNETNNFKLFEKLSFTGKYVYGLMNVLKNSQDIPEVSSVENIKKDLSENLEKIISLLKEITLNFSQKDKIDFEEKYLTISQNSFTNLQLLIEDLDSIKKYLNYLKRTVNN
jgi:hypothetical protein